MPSNPWEDWSPGVLCKEQIIKLSDCGLIENLVEAYIDGSSFDLHLSGEGYKLLEGTIKPCGDREYLNILRDKKLFQKLPQRNIYELDRNTSYVFKLQEKLKFKDNQNFYGQATAKSSIGRVDVLVRLIVDEMKSYDSFTPQNIEGNLYVEIIPITFKVKVRKGIPISQLRLFYGDPLASKIKADKSFNWLISDDNRKCTDSLSVDLSKTEIKGFDASAFCGIEVSMVDPIDLWEKKKNKPSPRDYWDPLNSKKIGNTFRLVIQKDEFYILRSKEKIALPGGVAVYCRAIDETIGEMRIHYAGFVHPWFGRNRGDNKHGTPLIFEVRGHSADVNLADGEKLANLIFFRMSQEAKKPKKREAYDSQTLKLSKFFADWS